MKKSIKAALLSGLVFPGVGYFVVNQTLRGIVVVAVSAWSVWFVVTGLWQIATSAADKILSGEMALDASSIVGLASVADTGGRSVASVVLLVCWIFSVLDGYRVGCAEDLKASDTKRV